MKILPSFTIASLSLLLGACQSLTTTTPATPTQQPKMPKFTITGKIGITHITEQGTQAGSAFYGWSQEDGRFSIDLTGALGLGATTIRYNGHTAELKSDKTGTITADSPETLLFKATGWHAPISQLSYWVVGRNAPSDHLEENQYSADKLAYAVNGDWAAHFEYARHNTPSRLRIIHRDGHRVVMTIHPQ